MGLIYWYYRSRRTCVQLHAFLLYFTRNQHFLLRQIHISVLLYHICMRSGVSISYCSRFIFLCSSDIFACVYLAAASTSSALLDIPSLQSHIVILEKKTIIQQQQHSHSMVFVVLSIKSTQNKNKTRLRRFTVTKFNLQLQPQTILWWNCQKYFSRMGSANLKVLKSLFESKTFEEGGKDQKNFQPPVKPMESLNCVAIFL